MDGKRDRILWLSLPAVLLALGGAVVSAQDAAPSSATGVSSNPFAEISVAPEAPDPHGRADPRPNDSADDPSDSSTAAARQSPAQPPRRQVTSGRITAGDPPATDEAGTADDQPLPADPNDARPLGDPENPDRQGSGSIADNWWLRTIVALAIVIGLIYATRGVLRRMGGQIAPASAGHVIEVLGRSPIGPKTGVMFLKLNHRILVVAQSPSGMDTLTEIDDPEEVAMLLGQFDAARPTSVSNSFRGLMERLDRLYQGQSGDGREPRNPATQANARTTGLAGGDRATESAAFAAEPRRAQVDGEIDRTREQLNGLLGRMRAIRRETGEGGTDR